MNFQPKSLSLILFAILVCLTTSTSAWDTWHNSPFQNISSFPTPLSPGLSGHYVSRYNPGNAVFAADRKTQYQWKVYNSYGAPVCNIFCGPKSYLTVHPNNTNDVVCKRDMSSNYWGGLTNGGNPYKQYCIPNSDTGCQELDVLKDLPIGVCDGDSFDGSYSNYDCCYNDSQDRIPHNNLLQDEVSLTTTSTATGLRNSQ